MSNAQLLAITAEARAIQREEREREENRLDCPYDGTPLIFNARTGWWICELGNYSRPGGAR